jgi:hypothetical protein
MSFVCVNIAIGWKGVYIAVARFQDARGRHSVHMCSARLALYAWHRGLMGHHDVLVWRGLGKHKPYSCECPVARHGAAQAPCDRVGSPCVLRVKLHCHMPQIFSSKAAWWGVGA